MAITPDGKVVSGGMDSKLWMWPTGQTRGIQMDGHSGPISKVGAGRLGAGWGQGPGRQRGAMAEVRVQGAGWHPGRGQLQLQLSVHSYSHQYTAAAACTQLQPPVHSCSR